MFRGFMAVLVVRGLNIIGGGAEGSAAGGTAPSWAPSLSEIGKLERYYI